MIRRFAKAHRIAVEEIDDRRGRACRPQVGGAVGPARRSRYPMAGGKQHGSEAAADRPGRPREKRVHRWLLTASIPGPRKQRAADKVRGAVVRLIPKPGVKQRSSS
jgi:hypothetical protein